MSDFSVSTGKHIVVMHESAITPYAEVATMVYENLDTLKYDKTVFVLLYNEIMYGPCVTVSRIRDEFKGYKIICYQLEQIMLNGSTWMNIERVVTNLKQFDEVWDYDQKNADTLAVYGLNVSKVLPMLYTEKLNKIPLNKNPIIDVLFYGFISPRRSPILVNITRGNSFGLKTCIVSGIYGDNLDKLIFESKIVLNIHAYENNRQEQARIFYSLINAKAVLSEVSISNNMGACIKEANGTKEIIEEINNLIKDKNWMDFGEYGREEFKKISKDRLEALK